MPAVIRDRHLLAGTSSRRFGRGSTTPHHAATHRDAVRGGAGRV